MEIPINQACVRASWFFFVHAYRVMGEACSQAGR